MIQVKTSFLINKVQAALTEEEAHPLQATPISPALPIDDIGLDAKILVDLEGFKKKATDALDFEAYMAVIEEAIRVLQLSPFTDFPRVAAVFNGYRMEQDMKPL